MKKLIAILAIMIVIVGAVFAATNNSPEAQRAAGGAEIDVTAKVPEAIPQFQLAISANQTEVIGSQTDDVALGTWSEITEQNPTSTLSAAAVTATTAALKSASIDKLTGGNGETAADVSVKFDINQIAKANLTASYSITVTASNLNLVKYSNGTDVPANTTLNTTQYFKVLDSGEPAVTAKTITGIDNTGTAGNVLKVIYNGTAQVDATTAAPKTLGEFTVTWEKNTTAVSGDYKASVKIQVESV